MNRQLLKVLGFEIRKLGYKGSGQNYSLLEKGIYFIINIQGSKWGGDFYVNLAAHPEGLPIDAGMPQINKPPKEYQCMFKGRFGQEWSWMLTDLQISQFMSQLREAERSQRDSIQRLVEQLPNGDLSALVAPGGFMTTKPRLAYDLARLCKHRGMPSRAMELIRISRLLCDGNSEHFFKLLSEIEEDLGHGKAY